MSGYRNRPSRCRGCSEAAGGWCLGRRSCRWARECGEAIPKALEQSAAVDRRLDAERARQDYIRELAEAQARAERRRELKEYAN